jgi:hypothetical protein
MNNISAIKVGFPGVKEPLFQAVAPPGEILTNVTVGDRKNKRGFVTVSEYAGSV